MSRQANSGANTENRVPCHVDSQLRAAIQRLHPLIKCKNAKITAPNRLPVCLGRPDWIETVWTNLLENAIKYGGKPPQIQIDYAELSNGQICFSVSDNGMGLTAAQQQRVFDPYIRFHQHQPEESAGLGVGLTNVQRMIRELGGMTAVESQLGQGSRFLFTLPKGPKIEEPKMVTLPAIKKRPRPQLMGQKDLPPTINRYKSTRPKIVG